MCYKQSQSHLLWIKIKISYKIQHRFLGLVSLLSSRSLPLFWFPAPCTPDDGEGESDTEDQGPDTAAQGDIVEPTQWATPRLSPRIPLLHRDVLFRSVNLCVTLPDGGDSLAECKCG